MERIFKLFKIGIAGTIQYVMIAGGPPQHLTISIWEAVELYCHPNGNSLKPEEILGMNIYGYDEEGLEVARKYQ